MKKRSIPIVRAYHWVPKKAFQKVVEVGYLTPAIERMSPEFFMGRCAEYIRKTMREIDVNPVCVQAIEHLIGDRIRDLCDWSRADSLQGEFSQLGCIDFMAKDHESVFLQVGRWIDWGSDQRPTGFSFDAVGLIREGAVFREKDLAPLYWNAVNKFLDQDWKDIDRAQSALAQAFTDVQRAHESRGDSAVKAVKAIGRRGASELLWNGRLPVSLAVESFSPDMYLEA